jgi:hypothetical protein
MPRHAAMEESDGGDLEKATVVVALEQLDVENQESRLESYVHSC